ncbi:unnamed protein product [Gordionus sp. m RMFG-2023]
MNLHIANKSTQNKIKLEPCIKWCKLKTMTDAFAINANIETINSLQVSEKMWTDLSSRLIDTAKSTLGLTRGDNKSYNELWWWNEEIQTSIQEKKALYKIW